MSDIIDVEWKPCMGQCIGYVLTQNEEEKFRVYVGVAGGLDEEVDQERIRDLGAKLSYSQAKGFFPKLKEEEYNS